MVVTVQTHPIGSATVLRHFYQCLPHLPCMRIPCWHFSLRRRGSQATPPLPSSTHTPAHAHSALALLQARTRVSSCQNLKICLTENDDTVMTQRKTHMQRAQEQTHSHSHTHIHTLTMPPILTINKLQCSPN